MNKPVTITLTILITLAILMAMSGAWSGITALERCELKYPGQTCMLTATPKP